MNYFATGDTIIAGGVRPDGAIIITEQQHMEAFDAQMEGRQVVVIDGELVIRDQPPTPEHTWENGKWVVPVEPAPILPFEDLQAAKKREISARRWEAEVAGITVQIGNDAIPVSTKRGDDREALHIAFSAINAGLRQDGAIFKFADEKPRAMSNADMLTIVAAALGHVQACFDHEAPLLAAVDAAEDEAALSVIDDEVGWPS